MTQEFVVYLVVALAAGYIVRTLWLSSTNKKGCGCDSGGCGKLKGQRKISPGSQTAREGLVQVTLNFNGSTTNPATKSAAQNGAVTHNAGPNGTSAVAANAERRNQT